MSWYLKEQNFLSFFLFFKIILAIYIALFVLIWEDL